MARILIVEDEVVLAMELEVRLQELGYEVVGRAVSGEEAVASAEEHRPDIVLMDIRLDGCMDGIETAHRMNARRPVPVIYLTAYADDATLERAKATEPFGYLVKPFSESELHTTIEISLYKHSMEMKLRESEERFRTIFESADDGMYLKDGNLRYTHVNPAMERILGLSARDMIGHNDAEIFGRQLAEQLVDVEKRVLRGQVVEVELTLNLPDRTAVCDYVVVPIHDASLTIAALCGIVRDTTERRELERELSDEPPVVEPEDYVSESMKSTIHQIRLAARIDSIVLLLGESGSGKDYLARILHDRSSRAQGPFFTINCAALPPELAESELFGHEPGAFTGSSRRKRGLLELAEGGTLLLNEIGELSPPLQAKLLTFLDTHTFTRVGGEKNISVNCRLVAATNRNLEREVRAGNFREDLFYRLSVIVIRIPSLRERMDDLPALTETLIRSIGRKMGLRRTPRAAPEVIDMLREYDWPGNVRELRNVLERGLIVSGGADIAPEHVSMNTYTSIQPSVNAMSYTISLAEGDSINDALNDAKRHLVEEGLRRTNGNVKKAAEKLGLSRDSLNYLTRTLGIRKK